MTTSSSPQLTDLDLSVAQLAAVMRFISARRDEAQEIRAAARSREKRMDVARHLDVLQRQQDALIARCHEHLRDSGDPQFLTAPVRAVVAHRQPWFVAKVAAALREHQVSVVATPPNGADAVGIAVAEQPELVLVEEALEMLTGEEVVREIRRFCPGAIIAAQVTHGSRVQPMLEAGATTVFTRQVAPADVASALYALLTAPEEARSAGASSPEVSAS